MSADGNWNVSLNTPMGAQDMTLTLKTDGGSLSGSLNSPMGAQEFSDGTANGDDLAWKVAMTQPMAMEIEFTAKVDGDAISGDAKLGTFGNATFSGARA